MKRNILFKALIFLCFGLILPLSGMAQSDFDSEKYLQFLNDNRNLESEVFLSRFAPQKLYYSEINSETTISEYEYLDSIKIKYDLTDSEMSLLLKNQFVVSERLSFDKITPALDDIFQKDLPVFVSTDAILHALHISYGNLLRDMEIQVMKTILDESVDKLYSGMPYLIEKYGDDSRFQASLEDVDLYITIAKSLMEESQVEAQYADRDIVTELWSAIQSEGFVSMPLFTEIDRLLDFSQFAIRGHYAQYEELHGYFKCMMWLGRMEFVLAEAPKEWYEAGFTREGLRRLNITALMVNELLAESEAMDGLTEIDRIIAFMVGESDNMKPNDFSELVRNQNIDSPEYLLVDDNFDSFLSAMTSSPEYQQKILSGYMKGNPETTEPTPLPVSYRLMGQRFIIDSYIFYKLVYDNVVFQDSKVCRMMPDPLDAIFALGNDNALPILREELEIWNYSSQLSGLRYLIDAFDDEFWGESLYNSWLQAIRLLNPSEENQEPPLFMRTVAWQQQKLNTQLASWTQLRHDNLLYAKQSYTHGGECMYPHSYVEPYPEFYSQIAAFAEKAETFDVFSSIRGNFTYQSVAEYFTAVKKTMAILEEISIKELNGEELNESEETFLGDMLIEGNGSGPEFNGWYVDLLYDSDGGPRYIYNPSDSDFLIADVHTQPTDCAGNVVGKVLHVGVGQVNLGVFLAESPSNGFRPMAYIGPVMSYYETITENFDRLTDERWTKLLQEGLIPERPDWVNVYLADKSGNSFEEGRELDGVVYTGIHSPGTSNSEIDLLIYPNPFSTSLSISYTIASSSNLGTFSSASRVDLSVYDLLGQKIETLVNTKQASGVYSLEWNTSDLSGGIYYLSLNVGNKQQVQKVVKMK